MDVRVAARNTRERIEATPDATWPPQGPLGREHVVGLLTKIEAGATIGEQAHRWLGWAQCASVAAGVGSLEDMKASNKAA